MSDCRARLDPGGPEDHHAGPVDPGPGRAASEGAAVRDETGRTYTAAAVALPSLRLSALRLAVAMAVSSGAERLEAAALVSDSDPDPADLAAVRDLGPDAPVFHAAPDGTLRATLAPLGPTRPGSAANLQAITARSGPRRGRLRASPGPRETHRAAGTSPRSSRSIRPASPTGRPAVRGPQLVDVHQRCPVITDALEVLLPVRVHVRAGYPQEEEGVGAEEQRPWSSGDAQVPAHVATTGPSSASVLTYPVSSDSSRRPRPSAVSPRARRRPA